MRTIGIFFTIIACFQIGFANAQSSSESVTPEKPALRPSQVEMWHALVGKWYGNQPTHDGGNREQIVERYIDGKMSIRFRICDAYGACNDQVELAQWGVSGPVYFSIFRGWLDGDQFVPSDPSDPHNYDAYRITTLSKEIFEYEHFVTGNKFTVKKVVQSFTFPEN